MGSLLWVSRDELKAKENIRDYTFDIWATLDSFLCDYYHSKACYFAVENGLFRSTEQNDFAKFVYPSLHSIKDETVTKSVTEWLRAYCGRSIKKSIWAKSLQKGANAYLAFHHGDIPKKECLVRGYWVATDTSDKEAYKDINPALTYPLFWTLAGWPYPHQKVRPQRIPPLPNSTSPG
jgi:hypothetical protein